MKESKTHKYICLVCGSEMKLVNFGCDLACDVCCKMYNPYKDSDYKLVKMREEIK